MPATAGRVRMPANNRVHSSAALQTHGIWQSAIGYDPYAPNKDESKDSSQPQSANVEPEGENAYANFQGLLALARITGSNADEARGACKKCGRVGHLAFQCRNFLSIKDDNKEIDQEAVQAAVLSGLERIKGNGTIAAANKEESEEEEETETSDSEVDSEIERIIAERYGKKSSSKRRSSRKKDVSDEDGSDSDSGGRKKRGRSKKRRSKKRESTDSEDEDKAKRKRKKRDKRKKRGDSSEEEEEEERHRHKRKSRKEKRRRRSHRYSDDTDSDASRDSGRRRRHKNRKAASTSYSDVSNNSDDSRIGRSAKRTEKRGKKHYREEDE